MDKKDDLIVVCGSVNANEDNFSVWRNKLRSMGFPNVIIPEDVPYYKEYATLRDDGKYHLEPYQKTANRLFYYKHIDRCWAIVIVNDVDYIGVETSMEVGYAYAKNKPIFITNIDTKIDGLLSLLDEGGAFDIQKLLEGTIYRNSLSTREAQP